NQPISPSRAKRRLRRRRRTCVRRTTPSAPRPRRQNRRRPSRARKKETARCSWACPKIGDPPTAKSKSMKVAPPCAPPWNTRRRKSYPLQLQGGEVLRKVLEAQVRVGEPVGEEYWSLLLELLQWLQNAAEFEEQAVNYAISFEVSPPSWEGLTAQQVAQAAAVAAEANVPAPEETDVYALHGVLTGPGEAQVMRVR